MASVKLPPRQSVFQQHLRAAKADGKITPSEARGLVLDALGEVGESKKPQASAEKYSKVVKGWVAKGTLDRVGQSLVGGALKYTAHSRSIELGAAKLKSTGEKLAAANPSLKDIAFSKTRQGAVDKTYPYLQLVDKKGVVLPETDARALLVKKLLGPDYQRISIGKPTDAFVEWNKSDN